MKKVLYAPVRSHTELVFRPETYALLKQEFDVTENLADANLSTEELVTKIRGMDALVTGWGTPMLSAEVFEAADKLQIIAHTAGSIRAFLTDELVETCVRPRRLVVFSANAAIAINVAEATMGLLIMTSRRWVDHVQFVRRPHGWRTPQIRGHHQFLFGAVVGVISASKVGMEVIRLLKPFDVRILLYDPCISDEFADSLGVERVGLDELFERSDMVTVHAPSLPSTRHMVGARQLSLLKNGATLINTARGSVIDENALIAECKRREIYVALDVTDPEPPAQDSELRRLPNVYITPHVSGYGFYGYHGIGDSALRALEDFFAGRKVEGAVDFERFAEIA